MIKLSSALVRIATVLPFALSALPAGAAAPVVAVAPAAAPAPAPGAEILKLPLQPVVPAVQRACSAKTASGLGTTVLRGAEGAKPGASDYVLVNYIGYLEQDGTVFDQNTRTPFQVDSVIAGFSEGMQLMTRGSVWRFCVPAAQGYGANSTGAIPANANLVFQVELVDFKSAAEIAAFRAQEAKAAEAQAQAPAAAEAPAEKPKTAAPKAKPKK
jgi:FKBP-type peptidyl-prolyl cis-trans isomerase FkpA